MIKTSLTCSMILAGAFAVMGSPANAQSVDETVSYIQGRCVNSTVYHNYPTGSQPVTTLSFNVQNGIMSWRYRNDMRTHTLTVPLADVSSVTHSGEEITIRSNSRSVGMDLSDDSVGAANYTEGWMYCPNADRIVRALEHLVSLEGDDPFAN